jgi:hypothetical protein
VTSSKARGRVEQSARPHPFLELALGRLDQWHADALSFIRADGIEGDSYNAVWLQINARLVSELDAKDRSDGALHEAGEFLLGVEGLRNLISQNNLEAALLQSLALVRAAHSLRGRVILRGETEDARRNQRKSVDKRKTKALPVREQVRNFREVNAALSKSECWEKWLYLRRKKSTIKRSTFFIYIKDMK